MREIVIILVVADLYFIQCVPPSPTSIVTDQLHAEFSTFKNTIKVLSDQWEKWNTLFITSLEPRITTTASTLASIDSNIHNLQERAHVWDTFQLHVSAWNEQLSSLDRKMDIISKGQEKVLSLDGKINAILSIEFKLDNTIKTMKKIEDTVNNLDIILHTKSTKNSHESLFSEFTSRGILSSIKMVEKKLDRLLLNNQNTLLKPKGNEKPKLQIRCNTPRIVEELLNDISSKVDVIFDNTNNENPNIDDYDDDEYLEVEGSGNINYKQANRKRLRKNPRKHTQICKHVSADLGNVLNRTIKIENSFISMLNAQKSHFVEDSDSRITHYLNNQSTEFANNINVIFGSYMSEQRAYIETIMENNIKKCCEHRNDINVFPLTTTSPDSNEESALSTVDISDTTPVTNITEENRIDNIQPTWKPILNKNKSSCEDLTNEDSSGVYIFENNLDDETTSNKRFCDIKNDGLWTVIQRRDNYSKQHNFNSSWEQYKYGFGDLHNDFWMGNNFIHQLSNNYNLILRIELEDFENKSAWAEYSIFKIASEKDNYKLTIGGYSGNASDSFSSHNGSFFSTFDKTNDDAPECCPCAVSYGGGWWFNKCFESNLNGIYFKKPNDNSYFRGIIWEHWLGNYSLKKTLMKIKSKGQVYTEENYQSVTAQTIPYYEDP